ncbi:MAG: alpha-L-fucosidase, partial [Rhodothermales bacterium]|nr:alpha-L-fucosidase [Rhodothermales bacterium]
MKPYGLFLAALLLSVSSRAPAQDSSYADTSRSERLSWFQDARLGIFIHWGIYAVDGIDESWSFFNRYVSYEDYMEQLDGFTAEHYDPADWARLIKASGARYAVLTSKHHDGVALWATEESDLSVVEKTPARRDLIAPFVQAMRDADLKVGLYFSHIDWSHRDYNVFRRDEYRYTDDPERWARYLDFHRDQIKELATLFEPDMFWFDGDWEHNAEEWKAAALRDSMLAWNPQVILNSRLSGYGDYLTPEQGLPITRPKGVWELCMTMNDSWGYQGHDRNYKTAYQIIRIFADVLGMGGNLLLDIGPKADGTIPDEQLGILESLGRWTRKHEEAIYGTTTGLPPGHFYGPTTLSKDRETL